MNGPTEKQKPQTAREALHSLRVLAAICWRDLPVPAEAAVLLDRIAIAKATSTPGRFGETETQVLFAGINQRRSLLEFLVPVLLLEYGNIESASLLIDSLEEGRRAYPDPTPATPVQATVDALLEAARAYRTRLREEFAVAVSQLGSSSRRPRSSWH